MELYQSAEKIAAYLSMNIQHHGCSGCSGQKRGRISIPEQRSQTALSQGNILQKASTSSPVVVVFVVTILVPHFALLQILFLDDQISKISRRSDDRMNKSFCKKVKSIEIKIMLINEYIFLFSTMEKKGKELKRK